MITFSYCCQYYHCILIITILIVIVVTNRGWIRRSIGCDKCDQQSTRDWDQVSASFLVCK